MLRWLDRWLEANRWAGDAVITVGLLGIAFIAHRSSFDSAGLLVSVALIVPLFLRRSAPRSVVVVVAVLCVLQVMVLTRPVAGDLAAPLVVHVAAAHVQDRRWGIAALIAALLGGAYGAVQWTGPGREQVLLVYGAIAASVVAAYLLGARQRDHRDQQEEQVAVLLERSRLLTIERDQRAEVAAAAERAVIARELHDIVAHSLSVIVVQADGAAAAVTAAPESAATLAPRVLDTIAETSREALGEMRRIVAVLRSTGSAPEVDGLTAWTQVPYRPSPGIGDLPGLVQQVQTAGLPLTLEEVGIATPLAATTALTVYRVVQESLTNVIKHAGPAGTAKVSVRYLPEAVQVDIVDDGRGSPIEPLLATGDDVWNTQPGHGLAGMRERVQLHGGRFSAGPLVGGGFAVHAEIPLNADGNVRFVAGIRQ